MYRLPPGLASRIPPSRCRETAHITVGTPCVDHIHRIIPRSIFNRLLRIYMAGLSRSVWVSLLGAVAMGMPSGVAFAQDRTSAWTVRYDTLQVTGNGPFLLKPWLIEGALRVQHEGRAVPAEDYHVDWSRGLVSFKRLFPDDSTWVLTARYEYIPMPAGRVRTAWEPLPSGIPEAPTRVGRQTSPSLVQSGSITRGVVAGSGRDAQVESALRFEITGEIAPGVEVTASLTDEDTPILPQGTTRRLDQLDRVFIRIASARGIVNMGDVEVNLETGRFGRVRRNLQGVTLNSGSRRTVMDVGLVGAVSKGRFRFQRLETADGVQGPYRLRGDQGEPFILVVPGSERVFLDGVLLVRGEVEDYTMDYHTAEITFTARHLIGQETRIRVEFEYTTNQFTRTFLTSNATVRLGSRGQLGSAGMTYIREADGSAFTQELAFTAADSLAVMEAGDQPVVRTGARPVAYNPDAPYTQYVKETAPDGAELFRAVDTVPGPTTEVYRVTFSRVGAGAGAYSRTGLAVNGVVYEYVGANRGDYNPVVRLSAPAAQDLLVFRSSLDRIPGLRVSGEVASSRLDANTLSPLDDADDAGLAWVVRMESARLPLRSFWSTFRAESSRRSAHFTSFARTRDVDFAHTWNLDTAELTGNALVGVDERMSTAAVAVGRGDSTQLELAVDRLDLGSAFTGASVAANLFSAEPGKASFAFRAEQTFTRRRDMDLEGTWRRWSGRLRAPADWRVRPFGAWQAAHLDSTPMRTVLSRAPDFNEYQGGVQAGKGPWTGHVTTTYRDESRWNQGSAGIDAQIWMLQTGGAFQGNRSQVTLDTGGRKTTTAGADANHALLLSLAAHTRVTDRVRFRASYSARSERSAVLQEIFIRTGPERGEYIWDDFNADGIIQVDEFLPETNPSEGEYVRALLPADSLEAVTAVQASVRLERQVANGNPLRGMGFTSTVEVMENSRAANRRAVYTLRPSALRVPGETIQGRLRLAQQVTLFPASHRFGVDLLGQSVRSLSGLSTGAELRESSVAQVALRYRPATHAQWGLRMARNVDTSESRAFATRSYDILSHTAEPSFRYRWAMGWTILSAPSLAWKQERQSNSAARVLQLPIEVIRETGSRARTTFRLEHARNNLDANRSGWVAWELTDGRGSGNSWLWRMGLQAELNESLTARLGYDGRKPARGSTVHTGRFQLTAFF